MKFYYDPVNDRIFLADVSVHGGIVELYGHIISTGTGQVSALDGFGTINIKNLTNYNLAISSLDTGTGSHGKIKITDTSKKTEIGGKTYYQVTQYNRIYNPGRMSITTASRPSIRSPSASQVRWKASSGSSPATTSSCWARSTIRPGP